MVALGGRNTGGGNAGAGPRSGTPAEFLCMVLVSVWIPSSNVLVHCDHPMASPSMLWTDLLIDSASFLLFGPCLSSRWARIAIYFSYCSGLLVFRLL